MASIVKFIDKTHPSFFVTVKRRVDEYFKERNISPHANFLMYLKTTFFLTGFGFLYLLIFSNTISVTGMLLAAVLLGMFTAFIGFNICHDAIHGSYSSNEKLNRVLGFLFNIIGANAYVWKITHNIVHHTYTNISGHDEDIEVAPGLIRISKDQKKSAIQQYQHWYAFPLYCLASLSWVFRKDYIKFFQKKIGSFDNSRPPKIEIFNLFFFKAVYLFLFVLLPLYLLDLTWWQFFIGFTAMHFAEGFVLGMVFQLAHAVEETDFPEPNDQGTINDSWAAHQMKTTANFATNNFLIQWFCGGLNMQIEHHLFPKVCHIHYPSISFIVRSTAKEFNLPYRENPTFWSAIESHYTLLKKFSKEY